MREIIILFFLTFTTISCAQKKIKSSVEQLSPPPPNQSESVQNENIEFRIDTNFNTLSSKFSKVNGTFILWNKPNNFIEDKTSNSFSYKGCTINFRTGLSSYYLEKKERIASIIGSQKEILNFDERILIREELNDLINYRVIFGNRAYFADVNANIPLKYKHLENEIKQSLLSIIFNKNEIQKEIDLKPVSFNFDSEKFSVKKVLDMPNMKMFKFINFYDEKKDFEFTITENSNQSIDIFIKDFLSINDINSPKLKVYSKNENSFEMSGNILTPNTYFYLNRNIKTEIRLYTLTLDNKYLTYFQNIKNNIKLD